jgi:hypothetical protein
MTDRNDVNYIEQFTPADLTMLHTQLTGTQVDSFQAAEIVANFLNGRGYGVSQQEARQAVSRIDNARCKVECIQAELERVARVM